ncbi:MAG: DUF2764 family protein [Chlamydiota bacterium]
MRNYYFVVPSLPPLALGDLPGLTFQELMDRLESCLSKEDLEKVRTMRLFVDICNIRSLLMEEPIDPRGNLSEKDLDEAILVQSVLPDYVYEFLSHYDKAPEKIRHFSGLLAEFFNREIAKQKGFLKKYFTFEREWRLVLVGIRSKTIGRDVAHELQFEDFTDPLVAQILAQKDSDRYDPPVEYAELKDLVASNYADPWLEQRAFAEYRFSKIAELAEGPLFKIDQVLSYMAQLMMIETINELNEERGKMILDTFKTG